MLMLSISGVDEIDSPAAPGSTNVGDELVRDGAAFAARFVLRAVTGRALGIAGAVACRFVVAPFIPSAREYDHRRARFMLLTTCLQTRAGYRPEIATCRTGRRLVSYVPAHRVDVTP
ncbi:hypothetical protein WS71_08770 [Burkholderia mayonis]|uniref:Uncharacterized protein n=1 Tax=Burkholderia mayonis TaxID=1385591 RepID=A0A1B4FUL8_9BURK|nr:hypothetical protein WS71_08770 [Burkholderia mayonis]